MKCPYCNYQDGWDDDKMEVVKGEEGSFYHLSNNIQMIRPNANWGPDEKMTLIGCPACNKVFMED